MDFSIRVEGEVKEFSIDFIILQIRKNITQSLQKKSVAVGFTKRIFMQEINYNLKFSVGDAAHIFKVQKDIIKTWCYKSSDYLSEMQTLQIKNTSVTYH